MAQTYIPQPLSQTDTSSFTPAQLSAFNAASSLAPTPPPITSIGSSNTAPQPPINLPAYTPPPSPLPDATLTANSLISQYATKANADLASAQGNQNDILSSLKSLYDTSGTKSQVTNDLTAANVDPLKAQLATLNNNLMQTNAKAFQADVTATNRGGVEQFARGEQAANQRQLAVDTYAQSAAIAAMNGEISNAQSYVDKAVAAHFDPIQAQISYQQQLLSVAQNNMTAAQKEKADVLSQQLQMAQTQAQYQRQDMQTGQALAISAMKLNPNNPAAQYAAQQAMKLSPTDPQYIQKVAALVGQYQQDPTATKQALLNLQSTRVDIAYKQAQIAALQNAGNGGSIAQDHLQTSISGRQYVDGSELTGKEATAAQHAAAQAGVPYVSKTDIPFLQNIDTTRQNLTSIQQALQNTTIHGQTGQSLNASGPLASFMHIFNQANYALQDFLQAGPAADALAGYDTWKASMISGVKALGGPGMGARGATLAQQLMQQIPSPSDTTAAANQKLSVFNQLLNNAETGILGTPPTMVTNGVTYVKHSDGLYYPQ